MRILSCCLLLSIAFSIQAQKKLNIKKPNLRIGEKVGKLTGNLMTAKTSDLSVTAPISSLVTGVYDPATKTSEVDYWPKGTQEGDHLMAITFMKSEGIGMMKIEGDVKCDGEPMEYIGLGSYGIMFDKPVESKKTIEITTVTGGKASLYIEPIADIEILEINGDPTLPILDLDEDFKIKLSHPAGAEGTKVKIGLLTDVAGARAWNYFADFDATADEVLIPKESFSNLEINGQLNAGQVNRGNTYIVALRESKTQFNEAKEGQITGDCGNATLQAQSYSSKPVIVKGKQENGVISELKFSGKHKDKLAYAIYKPNARTGLPFSRGSNFGLASLTINGRTYKQESESGEKSWTIGDTKYTQTWTNTTTYQFPQLSNDHWEKAMEVFYVEFAKLFAEKFNIQFVDVNKITSTSTYNDLFPAASENTSSEITHSYKGTKRTTPANFAEVWSKRSSDMTSETPSVIMMKEAGIDGLVSMEINFEIGADADDKIVLLPSVKFSIKGMDETKENKEGSYADGYVTFKTGIPYSEAAVKASPEYLAKTLNVNAFMDCIGYMIDNLRQKEVDMGYDKIWSIGE